MKNSHPKPKVLSAFVARLFVKAGLAESRARVVAEVLLEGDLLGHHTHGLALAPKYLDELTGGRMRAKGLPETVSDRGAVLVWDGRRLPGPWLVERAIETGMTRARRFGTASIAIQRSHHIACLAAYLRKPAEKGFAVLLTSSDPAVLSVAPFGSSTPLYTPNPIAFGYPTDGDPVLIDVSTSIATNALTARCSQEGKRLPGKWLVDDSGNATDDPEVLERNPPGALLPVGGVEYGHKGFALGLMVEALTQGLAGFGRADPKEGWGACVFVQVIDPGSFAGRPAFKRQTGWLADACREAPATYSGRPVRLPGDAALARRRESLRNGVPVPRDALRELIGFARRAGVRIPASVRASPGG